MVAMLIALKCTIFGLLCVFNFFETSTGVVTFPPRYLEMLDHLIHLQDTRCAKVSMCTMRSLQPCCQQVCECEKDQICIGKSKCCMQWYHNEFMSLTGMYNDWNSDTAAVSFHNSLRQYHNHSMTTTPVLSSRDGDIFEPYDEVEAECIDAKAATNTLQPEPVESITTYLMITRCPYNFSLTSPDIYNFELKCTLNDSSGPEIALNTPVTSVDTSVTYRNVYCYYCNEGEFSSNYVQWNAVHVCPINFWSRRQNFVVNPKNAFEKALQGTLHWCNVLYQPPPSITGLVTKCELGSTSTRCIHNTPSHIIKNICRQFYNTLEVLDKHIESINLENITCFLCTKMGLLTYGKTCWVFTPEAWETYSYLQLNTRPNIDNDTALVKGALTMPKGNCGLGMFTFNQTKACGNVYCPEYFFKQKGVCFPTYLTIENVYFKVEFVVRANTRNKDEQAKPAVRWYWSKTNKLIANLFSNYSYELYHSANGYNLECRLVIKLMAADQNNTFLRSYALVQLLMDDIREFRVRLSEDKNPITFHTQQSSRPYRFNKGDGIYKHVNLNTTNLKEMQLSKSSFCYRVVIPENEIGHRNEEIILMLAGPDILRTDVTLNEDSKEMVCIDRIVSGSAFQWKPKLDRKLFAESSDVTGKDEQSDPYFGDLSDLSKEIIITIIVICIIISIVVSRGVLAFIQRRQQHPTEPRSGPSD